MRGDPPAAGTSATGNPDHLDANVAAAALRLTGEEMARLQPLQF